jgi:hypothetical protein
MESSYAYMESSYGELLWRAPMESSYGEPLWMVVHVGIPIWWSDSFGQFCGNTHTTCIPPPPQLIRMLTVEPPNKGRSLSRLHSEVAHQVRLPTTGGFTL